ncbi:MAG: hypothetical protein H6815_14130 [Phycisphaeraceae bacterium]|nr:hypothetical protein [Phycisphaerales bacterium]MCB9861578.1 hypothetical protein [Phycisphaeraceae bacterium]
MIRSHVSNFPGFTCLVGLIFVSSAHAQSGRMRRDAPTNPQTRELVELGDPDVVLMLVRDIYRERATSDRVEVRYWADPQYLSRYLRPEPDRTSVVELRIVPKAKVANEQGETMTVPVLGIELEGTQVQIVDNVCEVVTQHNEDAVFRTHFDGAPTPRRIAEAIKPVPLPQIAFAFGESPTLSDLGAGVQPIHWTSVEEGDEPDIVHLEGTIGSGSSLVTIDISSTSRRIVGATFPANGDPGFGWIELRIEPRPSQPIISWIRDYTSRTEVSTFAALLPGRQVLDDTTPENTHSHEPSDHDEHKER